MDEERSCVAIDPHEPLEAGPTLSRVGRRNDSRVLAFVSAAAILFVAVAIAKPWDIGTQPPVPSGSTSSLAVAMPEPATASDAPSGSPDAIPWPATVPSSEALETPGSAVYLIETDGVLILALGCGDSVYTYMLPTTVPSADPAAGLGYVDTTVACASGMAQQVYMILPSPGTP